MRSWADSTFRKQAVVNQIVRNPVGWRAVDLPKRTAHEISNDFGNAIHATGTHSVEELRGKFRKESANTAASDDRCAVAPEIIGELAHTVEVRLQASQEDDVVPCRIVRVERTVPVFVVQLHIETLGVNQRSDVQTCDGLHHVLGPALVAARPQMGADNEGSTLSSASLTRIGCLYRLRFGAHRKELHREQVVARFSNPDYNF